MAQLVKLDTNSESTYGAREPRPESIRSNRSSGIPSDSKIRQMSTFVSEQTDVRPSFRRVRVLPLKAYLLADINQAPSSTSAPYQGEDHTTNTTTLPIPSLFSAVAKNRAQKKEQKRRLKLATPTLRPPSRMKKVDRGAPSSWRTVGQWAEDTETYRDDGQDLQLEAVSYTNKYLKLD